MLGRREPTAERAVIAFFGIRGIGSSYYVAFAQGRAPFESADLLWNAVSLVILISIALHGVTVTPIMRFIDKRRGRWRSGFAGGLTILPVILDCYVDQPHETAREAYGQW